MDTVDYDHIEQGAVQSPDGSILGYMRLGKGKPLVVCHGSFGSAQDWLSFARLMAPVRTVFLYDRRGRGMSPYIDADFGIDAEVDDLAAIMRLAGSGTALLGHSFGGGCALSFAAREKFTESLIVYEPRHAARGSVSRGRISEIVRMVAIGDRDATMQFVMSEVIDIPPQALTSLRQTPRWEPMCQTVDAFPKELRLLDSLTWQAGDLDGIAGEIFLLVGDLSPTLPDDISPDEALRSLMPNVRSVSIPGQGHFAYIADPALLADIVSRCLGETGTQK